MVNVATLSRSINDGLTSTAVSLATATRALRGVKLDPTLARVHLLAAQESLDALAVLILSAKNEGILMPPDVLKRANDSYKEISQLFDELLRLTTVQKLIEVRVKASNVRSAHNMN